MPRTVLLTILLISLAAALFSAQAVLPAPLTAAGNPQLYNAMHDRAIANLSNLPKALAKPYKTMLRQHPDILMAFLIAYESNAVLAEANPRDVKSNYLQTAKLLQIEGLDYSPELFLSYIAKQTVSDERITPYRELLWTQGLNKLWQANPIPIERYRAISLWCVENLVFNQTSGRDQSAYDITQKSYVGRCEEMQILFVAACRIVGIPARPASTPYWAHMDNNHAWAEVYLNDKWVYTGDMDSAYFPNQTWFSGMVDKTVLILTEGAIPAAGEEVLQQDDSGAVINSTPNYLGERIRKLSLQVLDSTGMPVPRANVNIMVYNWASLRPIVQLQTDQSGELNLSVGRGAFYVLAYKDSLRTLIPVASSSDSVITLTATLDSKEINSTMLMEYPSNAMNWQQAPEIWNEGVRKAKAIWQAKVDAYTKRSLLHSINPSDSLMVALWIACCNNQDALESFVNKHNTAISPEFVTYLLHADPKFLWQASEAQFDALYSFFLEQQATLNSLDEQAVEVLMSPTVLYEELPLPFFDSGKAKLYPQDFYGKAGTPEQKLHSVIAKLSKHHKIESQRSLSGLLRLDLAAERKYLKLYQFKILACSALRANGIPADYARVADLINVYLDGKWMYYSLSKNAFADQSKSLATTPPLKAEITIQDSAAMPVDIKAEHLQLSFYQEGGIYPLNQQPKFIGNGSFEGEYPAGEYLVQIGYRISESKTFYSISTLKLQANQANPHCIVTIQEYEPHWEDIAEELAPIAAELDKQGYQLAIVGNYQQENSMRLDEKLGKSGKGFAFVGADTVEKLAPEVAGNYILSTAWSQIIRKDPDQKYRTYTLYLAANGKWKMYQGLWENLPE